MSELKAYTYDDMLDGDANIDIEYYQKSEVDTAIAELKAENYEKWKLRWLELAEKLKEGV